MMRPYEPSIEKLTRIITEKEKLMEVLVLELNMLSNVKQQYQLSEAVEEILALTDRQYETITEKGKNDLVLAVRKGAQWVLEENRENHDEDWYFHYMITEEFQRTRLQELFSPNKRKFLYIPRGKIKEIEDIILDKIEKMAKQVLDHREPDKNFERKMYKEALFEIKACYPGFDVNQKLFLLSKSEKEKINQVV